MQAQFKAIFKGRIKFQVGPQSISHRTTIPVIQKTKGLLFIEISKTQTKTLCINPIALRVTLFLYLQYVVQTGFNIRGRNTQLLNTFEGSFATGQIDFVGIIHQLSMERGRQGILCKTKTTKGQPTVQIAARTAKGQIQIGPIQTFSKRSVYTHRPLQFYYLGKRIR